MSEQPPVISLKIQSTRLVRVSRHLERAVRFYRDGIGLQELSRFTDNKDYSGVRLGIPGQNWEMEITQHKSLKPSAAPEKDNLLIFYLDGMGAIGRMVITLGRMGYYPVSQEHPLWHEVGVTFEDPDGWRVVLVEQSGK
jgi:catechol 2,3-dioxygenase-like lactoylglutathione lyase family enzyme